MSCQDIHSGLAGATHFSIMFHLCCVCQVAPGVMDAETSIRREIVLPIDEHLPSSILGHYSGMHGVLWLQRHCQHWGLS